MRSISVLLVAESRYVLLSTVKLLLRLVSLISGSLELLLQRPLQSPT